MNDKELMKKLKEVFIQEAKERLTSMSSNLISLEQGTSQSKQAPALEEIYRDAHSLKGASRSIGQTSIESVFQVLEDIFNEVKESRFSITSELFDILQDFIKTLNKIINSANIESPKNVEKLKKTEKILIDFLPKKNNTTQKEQLITEKKKAEHIEKKDIPAAKAIEPNEAKMPINKKPAVSKEKIKEPEKFEVKEEALDEEAEEVTPATQDTVRISSGKLDSLLLKSENMIRIKQMFYEHIPILYESLNMIDGYNKRFGDMSSDYFTIKQELVDTEGRDRRKSRKALEKITEGVEENNNNLKSLEAVLKDLLNIEKENHRNTEKILDGFLYDIKEIAMLPFSNILFAFPIMVREISKKLDKNIVFTMKGEEIKLDRRILQEIKDPLVHLIRNSIDHGIESLSARKESEKQEKGSVELNISQREGNKILITIRDDGSGISVDEIKKQITEKKLLSQTEADLLTNGQILEYIFHSGFSTTEIITDLSGRGLGLAIVKSKIESLGGKVLIDSKKGEYTEIQITLPITLATFKGVLVKTENRTYVIPSNNLKEAVRVQLDCVKTIENKRTIYYNKETYPLVKLSSILGLNGTNMDKEQKYVTAAIVVKSNELMALEIDDIIEEQEILIKDLGSQLKKIPNLTGATILNSGEIVPILNVYDLFKSATNLTLDSPKPESKPSLDSENIISTGKKTILVVEDSITSRILLKNILESAGYITETAVDGVDALAVLKSKEINLVVSDIEMPRMDGFTLTSQIKADETLKKLPVVLVTSRSTEADKERGGEVGASAYIIKSEFDQTNLMNTIKTLL